MFLSVLCSVVLFQNCGAVIYHLNDTEYNLMPPLMGLDDYNTCLLAANGTYCVAKFDLLAGPNVELMNLIQEYSKHTPKHYNHSYIQRGICVTKTCRNFLNNKNVNGAEELAATLEACLNDTVWNDYGLQTKLSNLFHCDKHGEQDPMNYGDTAVLYLITILIVMNIVGSFYEICQRKYKWNENRYITSFSVFKNWEWLTTPETAGSTVESLKGFYGIKTVTTILIVLAHVMLVSGTGFTDNTHDFEKAYESPHYMVIFNGMAIVQIFFVISGFLLIYNLQVYSEKQKITWSLAPKLLFLRWWRLAPAIAIMLAFTATWLHRLGSGPFWKYNVSIVAIDCRQHWWKHLLFINNYFPNHNFCALQTWHVAADMQLFCVGLVTYIATKNRGRWLAMVILLLIGVIAPAWHVWLRDLDGMVLQNPEFYRGFGNENFWRLHVLGHNNLSCFVIGMAVGYLTYDWQSRRIDLSKYKIYRRLFALIIPAVVALFYNGRQFYADQERASLAWRMMYASLHRVVLGVIIGLGLIMIVMKIEDAQRGFFEWRGWVVPGRLTYCVYLLHMNMIHVLMGIRTTLDNVSFYKMFIIHLGITWLAFILALPYHLLVECSMNRLMKTILDHNWRNEKKIK